MWLFKYTITDMARQNLASRMSHPGTSVTKGILATFAQVANRLLKFYATDANVFCLYQEALLMKHGTIDPVEYANTLNYKGFVCGNVFTESKVMSIFFDGAESLIVEKVRQYCTDHPDSNLTTLANHDFSLRNTISTDRKGGKSSGYCNKFTCE